MQTPDSAKYAQARVGSESRTPNSVWTSKLNGMKISGWSAVVKKTSPRARCAPYGLSTNSLGESALNSRSRTSTRFIRTPRFGAHIIRLERVRELFSADVGCAMRTLIDVVIVSMPKRIAMQNMDKSGGCMRMRPGARCAPYACYQRMLQNGLTKKQAVCAAMRKLLHLIIGVLKSGKPFDPSLHNTKIA